MKIEFKNGYEIIIEGLKDLLKNNHDVDLIIGVPQHPVGNGVNDVVLKCKYDNIIFWVPVRFGEIIQSEVPIRFGEIMPFEVPSTTKHCRRDVLYSNYKNLFEIPVNISFSIIESTAQFKDLSDIINFYIEDIKRKGLYHVYHTWREGSLPLSWKDEWDDDDLEYIFNVIYIQKESW